MAGALNGVTVLEVADYITGPLAGMMLADMGADVIKIEKRPNGDPFRGFDREGTAAGGRDLPRGRGGRRARARRVRVLSGRRSDRGRVVTRRRPERAAR